jgi:hypothetical protein
VAARRAAAWFWSLLQDFVDLGVVPEGWQGLAPSNPFIGVSSMGGGGSVAPRLCLNLPPEFSLPADLTFEVD